MITSIFYDGFEKSEQFYVRYNCDHDLDLDLLDHERNFNLEPILLLKMRENFQNIVLDLYITFKIMVKVICKVIMNIEGHMKVKYSFLKIYPHF